MTALSRLAPPVVGRRIGNLAAVGVPLVAAVVVVAAHLMGVGAAIAAALLGIGAVGLLAWRARRVDPRWLARRLDAAGDTDDSAELLFADDLSPLASLQRARLERRIAAAEPDLRPPWRVRTIAAAWVAAAVIVAAVFVPRPPASTPLVAVEPTVAAPGVPRLVAGRIRIVPPPYTRLAGHDAATLDVRAPQGSRLEWTLRFAPQPAAAALVLADGTRTPLVRAGDVWTARRLLDRSALYRVVAEGGARPPLHRLDALPDVPPEVRVVAPERSLTVVAAPRPWPLRFEAHDDYGVAATARLHLTIAEGDGENVKFRDTVVAVRGTGSARAMRFAVAPDLAALKFARGSDLVAYLEVADTRSQIARSPSVILRWPAIESDAAGMEGVVTHTAPAIFRSERQIIIDAETLLKAEHRLPRDGFVARSDAIGADQRLLRLRYGQFLGEEQEGTQPLPPTADATPAKPAPAAPPTADAPPAAAPGAAPSAGPPAFGSEGATLAQFGHVHDEAEAATLLDPDTKAKLKGALDAMWQAELALRQGAPRAALPFAYRALGLIKQVQQATRIFLARVGPVLPQVDETRRLTGKRDGLVPGGLPPVAGSGDDPLPATVVATLATREPTAAQLAALGRWGRAQSAVDPLALAAAIDAIEREPRCAACRRALAGLVWRALPRPAAGVTARAGPSAIGRRYLDALGRDQ